MYDTFSRLLLQSCSALELVAGEKMSKRVPRKILSERPSNRVKRINFRITDAEDEQIRREAAGKTTVSALAHSRVFGSGMRNHDVLRQVAALHQLGMKVKALADRPGVPAVLIQETLVKIQQAVRGLAKDLP